MKKLFTFLLLLFTLNIIEAQTTVNMKFSIEGLYDRYLSSMTVDTVKVYLRNGSYPFKLVDSAKKTFNPQGNVSFVSNKLIDFKSYFLIVKYKNSLENWSSVPVKVINNTLTYDFTTSEKQTYGNNAKVINGKYNFYSGDIDGNGYIDFNDALLVYNDNSNFVTGYVPTDVDGDKYVSLNDVNIVYNNYVRYVSSKNPLGISFKKYATPIFSHVDSHYIWCQYNPVRYTPKGDSLVILYKTYPANKTYMATSKDGKRWNNRKVVTSDLGYIDEVITRIDSTNWRGVLHKLINQNYRYVVMKSSNGGTYWNLTQDTIYTGSKSILGNSYAGEDISGLVVNNDSTYIYFRDSSTQKTLYRSVALTKTKNWKDFTNRKQLFKNDRDNFKNPYSNAYLTSMYEFNAIKTGTNEWFGFANMFTHRPDMVENNPPPYAEKEHTIEVKLYFSTDGENWQPCADTLAIIPSTTNKKQVYGIPSIVGDSVYVYTIEQKARHNGSDTTPGNFEICLYTISLNDLRLYRPQ